MDCVHNALSEGIGALRHSDGDIDALIAPRQDEVLRLLSRYIAEIELFNPAYGLVGAENTRELIIKHILDSLAPLGIMYRLLADQKQVAANNGAPCIADVGSGAGLPGIPLAIALPQAAVTLIERMGRRAGFLRNTQAVLGLSNVVVEETEMEKAGGGRFSLVTFRALRPLEPKMLTGLFRLCGATGMIAAYKGRREKAAAEMAALQQLAPQWELLPCPVPMLDEERHLLVIGADFLPPLDSIR